ncbi:MAG: DUF547 domain-containing protein [Kiloniellales bacterium]|nr:DUF547 domain-containing protein [Kiloniellales bacterium]
MLWGNRRRAASAIGGLAAALALGACSQARVEANFVPDSDPWPRWEAHDARATGKIDHSHWDDFLGRHVSTDESGLNRIAYDEVTPGDRAALDAYIASLEAIEISAHNRPEQFAYWVNLYNAVTVRTVLENYPVDSIRDINDGLLSPGPWDRPLVGVEGETLTLNDIESRILRPLWQDPRVHYVLNCASVGCPNLDATAYEGASLEARLDQAARSYINNPRGVRLEDGELVVSSIYAWFEGDFGGSEDAVLAHLGRYADPELKQALSDRGSIDGYAYDWALNDGR